jgi:hypothetical protein
MVKGYEVRHGTFDFTVCVVVFKVVLIACRFSVFVWFVLIQCCILILQTYFGYLNAPLLFKNFTVRFEILVPSHYHHCHECLYHCATH